MRLLKPRLAVARLVVKRRGKTAYDEAFHSGLNVIRGTGSSGKSTISELLFYGLGGEGIEWQPEARLCDEVYVEIMVNEAAITLRRDITDQPKRPMWIHWDTFDKAMKSPLPAWMVYPFSQAGSNRSFSQVLFDALRLPQVKGEYGSRLTMNAIMRLMYVDQESSANAIFREEQFDPSLKRQAIGELLCGFYDGNLYEYEIKTRQLIDKRDSLKREISAMYRVLQDTDQVLSTSQLKTAIENKEVEAQHLRSQIDDLHSADYAESDVKTKHRQHMKNVRQKLAQAQKSDRMLSEQIDQLALEIADSSQFMQSLKKKLEALDASQITQDSLGQLEFQFCPACYRPIDYGRSEGGVCLLCKVPSDGENVASQLQAYKNDVIQQLDESRRLQDQRNDQLEGLHRKRQRVRAELREADREFNRLSTPARTPVETALAEVSHQLGYVERELEGLLEKLRTAELMDRMIDKESVLNQEIEKLGARITHLRTLREKRERDVRKTIDRLARSLLEKDLDREEAFKNVSGVEYDFGYDRVTVNGRRKFSASSMIYLRNAFHLAILMASLEKEYMRYPRFLLTDNIEGGGMEEKRSHNFQRLVASLSAQSKTAHQIIMTTSMIAPELDKPGITVGESYGPQNKSLKNIPSVDLNS